MAISWTQVRDLDAPTPGRSAEFTLPSRETALAMCLRGLAHGPVLITGEAGSGKSWLAERVGERTSSPRDWMSLDLCPSLEIGGLRMEIGRRLGIAGDVISAQTIADALTDETADGRRWGLVLDEVHLASNSLLEEIRVLVNHLGQPDAFESLVIVGQSHLKRRLSLRSAASLASRISARVHLNAIDADEAGVLIDHLAPGCAPDHASLERCHRDAAGNPRRLLMLARTRSEGSRPTSRSEPADEVLGFNRLPGSIRPKSVELPDRPTGCDAIQDPDPDRESRSEREQPSTTAIPFEPFLVRTPFGLERPPIVSEEGMIEVGWEPDLGEDEVDPIESTEAANSEPVVERDPHAEGSGSAQLNPSTGESDSERLADHYAALQAWEEWSSNQDRTIDHRHVAMREAESASRLASSFESDDRDDPYDDAPDHLASISSGMLRSKVRAEDQHVHSPFGQLFQVDRRSRGKGE